MELGGAGSLWDRRNRLREGPGLPGLHTTGCFPPTGYTAPYLTVFSENALDVFDVRRAEWVQTVPLKKVKVSPDRGSGAVGDMA